VSSMPDFMQTIAAFTPVYGISQIARAPLTGEAIDPLWLVNAVVWLVLFVAGTAWAFRRDTQRV
jgi:ABC-2 type transport system permease protein